jgi:hypothetical protein
LPGRAGNWFAAGRNNDLNVQLDEIHCELGKTVGLAFRRPALDCDRPTFHIAELAQALTERCERRNGSGTGEHGRQIPDARYLRRWLRLSPERRGEEAARKGR